MIPEITFLTEHDFFLFPCEKYKIELSCLLSRLQNVWTDLMSNFFLFVKKKFIVTTEKKSFLLLIRVM